VPGDAAQELVGGGAGVRCAGARARGGWGRGMIRVAWPGLRHGTRGTSRGGGGGREARGRGERGREGATRRGRHAEGGGGRQRARLARLSSPPPPSQGSASHPSAHCESAPRDTCCAQRAERDLLRSARRAVPARTHPRRPPTPAPRDGRCPPPNCFPESECHCSNDMVECRTLP
jgi:hypothetical protein